MKMEKYGGVMDITNKLISEYSGEMILGILAFSAIVYNNSSNLDADNLYQLANYLK